MKRRELLKAAAALPLLPFSIREALARALDARTTVAARLVRPRPGSAGWPSPVEWKRLRRKVGGRLRRLQSPFAGCTTAPADARCTEAMKYIDNPFALGDDPALTQTSGWIDAWTSHPSAWVVAAEKTADVVAAVDFARRHGLRLVVKGGGHSYQGTSAAPDSLLVWTRRMNRVTLPDTFVAQGCEGHQAPVPAVTIEAGAMWSDAYDAVTTRGGRYVQGGGCATVGVAGLVQSGGFGSFSRAWGTAAGNLLEVEVVTADGKVRIANALQDPELFWAIKGGGGGSLGVVTRLTLRTFDLPQYFGGVFATIHAASDDAFRTLLAKMVAFHRDVLFDAHWGEQLTFEPGNRLVIAMVFQGLDQEQAQRTWAPFVDWVDAQDGCRWVAPLTVRALPARHFWDAAYLRAHAPDLIVADDRPHALAQHVLWAGDRGQVGWFIHGYQSAWLPASLLQPERQPILVDALFAASRHRAIALHLNKGLAGAAPGAIERARDTAMHPQVLDAFALAICAGGGAAAFPDMPGAGPDLEKARRDAGAIDRAMQALRAAAPAAGSYVSESDYFLRDWQQTTWGDNYPRLARIKRQYDPHGLFFVHHGVGSEGWSADGFTREADAAPPA